MLKMYRERNCHESLSLNMERLVGCSYMSAVEFGDKVHAGSLVAYGTSGDPRSPHFENQRQLLAEGRYKNAYYYPDEVLAAAKRSYHPGEE